MSTSPPPPSDTPTRLETYQIQHNPLTDKTRYLLLSPLSSALYWGEANTPIYSTTTTPELSKLPRHPLNIAEFFPRLRRGRDDAPSPRTTPSPSVYIKKQRILRNDTFLADPGRFEILTRGEVRICEIASFDDIERVTGIAYERYTMTLAESPVILDAVEKAMKHQNSLGIVHCDLQPWNVFLRLNRACEKGGELEEIVVGDFDSALEVGEVIELKHATKFWSPEDVGYGAVMRREGAPWRCSKHIPSFAVGTTTLRQFAGNADVIPVPGDAANEGPYRTERIDLTDRRLSMMCGDRGRRRAIMVGKWTKAAGYTRLPHPEKRQEQWQQLTALTAIA
ncbi:hypothetical protein K458DRAFT_427914 [Lentithecium fluviatile CBS 122367]|uniref:Protein kinase domain-containing protein n=1 Tax=Lentithecium fluviatile CBS 122367 TaxID=1168545 RepID=A0A6G1JCY0_9PLEO|nr:hypothetical protein K458DRAFT_427914 [Lentithecium fluviatile CBS 122367]